MTKYFIQAATTTWLKNEEKDSSKLTPDKLLKFNKDEKFEIDLLETNPKTNHVRVNVVGKRAYFAFRPHVRFIDDSGCIVERIPVVEAVLELPPLDTKDLGAVIKIPGITSTTYVNQPVFTGSTFTWAEVLNNPLRIPKDKQSVANIISTIKAVQIYREKLGLPFMVTSMYRPEPYNSRVGGARFSKHLTGRAIDFHIPGKTREDLWNIFNPVWDGGVGIYKYDRYIIHLDIDGKRRWRG